MSTPKAAYRWHRAPRFRPATLARTGRFCARCPPCSAKHCLTIQCPSCARRCWQRSPISCGSTRSPRAMPPTCRSSPSSAARRTRHHSIHRCRNSISPTRSRARPRSWRNARRWQARPSGRRRSRAMTVTDFFWTYLWPLIIILAESVLLLVLLLVAIAYVIYADRKIWAAVQIRRGPNVVGPWGLFQSFADMLKFALKEPTIPSSANKGVFLLAPLVSTVLALAAWAVIPVNTGWVIADINVGVLYIFAISSLMVYGVIMAGWASNSKYPFLAALRSAAQMVSYEVSIGFVIITVLLCAGSLNLSDVVEAQNARGLASLIGLPRLTILNWYVWPLLPMFVVFYVSALAETNRPPFDLVEAESELVAGFMVEYGSTPYLLFMLGEYVAITTMCAMATILFLGGWLPPVALPPFTWVPGVIWFSLKLFFMFFLFAMAKAIVPRYRHDQLMRLGWKVFLPLSLAMVVIVAGVLQFAGIAPK